MQNVEFGLTTPCLRKSEFDMLLFCRRVGLLCFCFLPASMSEILNLVVAAPGEILLFAQQSKEDFIGSQFHARASF